MPIGILSSLKHFFNSSQRRKQEEIFIRRLEIATEQEWAVSAILKGDLGQQARDRNCVEHFRNIIGNIDWIFLDKSFHFESEKEKNIHEIRIKSLRKKLAEIGVESGYSKNTFEKYIESGFAKFSAAGFNVWIERLVKITASQEEKIKNLIQDANAILLEYLRNESIKVDQATLESIERTLN